MKLTGISNRGLIVISFLVAILWACIITERSIVQQARQETDALLRSRQTAPVAVPVKHQHINPRLPFRVAALPGQTATM